MRTVAFIIFFGIGAAVLSATSMCNVLLENFYLKDINKKGEDGTQKLVNLNADYDALLGRFEGDPCQIARLAPATLGIEPNEPNTAFPRASADKLAAARQALSEEPNEPAANTQAPEWLSACCSSPRKQILFSCGAALILVAFVCFGPTKRPRREITMISRDKD